jgi:TonB family protein
METVVRPPAEAELHLLTDWSDPDARSRRRTAAVGTIAVHVATVMLLAALPDSVFAPPPPRPGAERPIVTPLVEPMTELTQKAPNKGPVNKEFNATEMKPRPRVQIPAGPPSTTRPFALPPVPVPKATPPQALPEPPKVDAGVKEPSRADLAQIAPTPQIQLPEKPKLTLENAGAPPPPVPPGRSQVPVPNPSVSGAIRGAIRGGAGGMMVGDPGASGPGGYGEGVNLPPTPGSQGNNLQLLSDPLGVDFRPYLMRVLAAVRLHWLAVLPESVKMGRKGRVAIQFSIGRDGNVPKLVIAGSSGADALDRAAVAGISASVPFPPLPTDFRGDIIKLQFNFAYNMPRQ